MKRFPRQSLYIAVLILYLLARLVNLDAAVTTDEPFWLGRSANFYRAISTGEYEHTYQMAHPGVMTMWAGTLAYMVTFPEYAELAAGNMSVPYGIEKVLRSMGQNPLHLMVAAKISKILLQGVFFLVALAYIRRLFDDGIALITGALIAFGPYLSGLDSILHVDGLFTILCFGAVMAITWAAMREDLVSA